MVLAVPPLVRRTPRPARPGRWAALAAALLVGALGAARAPRPAAGEDPSAWVRLVVLHTNDQHGALLPRTPDQAAVTARGPVGGYAALAAFVGAERARAAEAGAHVLLLDGGDVWIGTPEGQLTRGDLVVEALGRLRYDAVAVGNHEFDFGVENARRLAARAPFPWISANVYDAATGKPPPWVRGHVVKEVGGLRVAIVGLTTTDTPRLVAGGDRLGLAFPSETARAVEMARELEGAADLLVFLTHCGPERDREILRAVPRCPLVVGGHSHTRLHRPIDARGDGSGWIVQAGTQTVVAGRVALRVHRATKEVVLEDARLVPLAVERVGSDPAAEAFLRERLAAIPDLAALEEVVTTLEADLVRATPEVEGHSPAAQVVADAIRAASGADVALHNRGGVRTSLPRGPATRRDLFVFMPFDNTVVVVPMTGAGLASLLASSLAREGSTPLEPSGIEGRWRFVGEGSERRVVWRELRVGGSPVEGDRVYRVAVNSFLAGGGDGYRALRSPQARDTGVPVRDAIQAHLGRAKTFRPPSGARLVREP